MKRRSVCTLNDVAKAAGVSKSTVSRVLNNKLGKGFSVKKEVRERIIAVARKLHYRPNLIAKSLTLQTTKIVHIIGGHHALSDLGNIYQTVVNEAVRVLENSEHVFDVTVDMSKHSVDSSELPNWNIDGAIILTQATPTTMNELESIGIPYVVVNGPAGENGYSVVPDDVDGTKKAMKYLASLGHKRIAYANSLPKHIPGHSSLTDRHDTYLREAKRLNVSVIPGHENWLESAEDFLKSAVIENGATAILAYGHLEGLNLMQAAHRMKIRVPGQLSIICFCDQRAAQVMTPYLSFVNLRSEDMGRIAADLLLKCIESKSPVESKIVKLPETIVERGSTAPPEE